MLVYVVRASVLALLLPTAGALEASAQVAVGRSTPTRISLRPPRADARSAARLAIERLRFEDDSGDRALEAGEEGWVVLDVVNAGRGAAEDVEVMVAPEASPADVAVGPAEVVPTLDAGARRTVRLPVRGGADLADGRVTLLVTAMERRGFDADPVRLAIEVRARRTPELVIVDALGIEDGEAGLAFGNNNGRLEPGETAEITLLVQNRGRGPAGDVRVTLSGLPKRDVYTLDEQTTTDLGVLAPGASRPVIFAITPNKRYGEPSIPLTVHARDRASGTETELRTAIPLNRHTAGVPTVVVPGYQTTTPTHDAQAAVLPGVDVDLNVPRTGVRNPEAVAVVIGNRRYASPDVPTVEYALRGAETIRQYLIHGLGFRPENILFEEDASKSDLERLFGTATDHRGQLFNYLRPGESDVFVYYQGHGAPDLETGRSYLVPSDAAPNFIRLNGYPVDVLFANLAQLPVRSLTVALDACFSGFTEAGPLVRGASPALLRVENPVLAMENAVVFTAAEGTQVSSWYEPKKHGLFTYFFLRGLQGDADGIGGEKNGQVTAAEMDAFLQTHVPVIARRTRNRTQTPQLLTATPDHVLITVTER